MTNSIKAVAAVAAVVVKSASKVEAGYVADLATKLLGADKAAKELMLAVHGLASKVGADRAGELALFAFEKAYPAGIPKQRVSQVKQFCALPEAQRAELCKQYGSIGKAAICRSTVSPTGVYTPPVKVERAPVANAGPAKDAGGTPLLTAQPSTVIASVLAQLEGLKPKLTKAQTAVLASILADVHEFADMIGK